MENIQRDYWGETAEKEEMKKGESTWVTQSSFLLASLISCLEKWPTDISQVSANAREAKLTVRGRRPSYYHAVRLHLYSTIRETESSVSVVCVKHLCGFGKHLPFPSSPKALR